MAVPKKFSVVKFPEVSKPGKSLYVVVPTFWVKNRNNDYATVPYPSQDELSLVFERIVNCQPALVEWKEYHVIIEREANTYEAGMLYIKCKDSTPLEEEVLMLWRHITLEFLNKLGYFNPCTIIYRLWSWFWNSKN